jgi:hypothetical protein
MRCHTKNYLADLKRDPNSPGLLVCSECCDVLDPYRLPQRQTEDISLKRISPDTASQLDRDTIIETDNTNDILTDENLLLEE